MTEQPKETLFIDLTLAARGCYKSVRIDTALIRSMVRGVSSTTINLTEDVDFRVVEDFAEIDVLIEAAQDRVVERATILAARLHEVATSIFNT